MNETDIMKEQLLDEIFELKDRLKQRGIELERCRRDLDQALNVWKAVKKEDFVLARTLIAKYEADFPF